ncbi:unnamed protein product [Linum tenue]|nr:unnamed protein product [Linum tenue]
MPDKINDVDVRTEETKPLRGFSWAKKGRVEKYNILLDPVLSVIHKLEATKLTGTGSSSNRSTISYCLHFLQNQKIKFEGVDAIRVEASYTMEMRLTAFIAFQLGNASN